MNEATISETPWLARPEWVTGRIASSQGVGLIGPWIFAVGAGGITGAYLAAYGLLANPTKVFDEPGYLILLPFVLVSVGLLISAMRKTWRAVRSGPSTLELSSLPGVIGGKLEGTIQGGPVLHQGQGVRLVLRCIVSSWSRSTGGRSRLSTTCRWEDDRELSPAEVMGVGAGGSVIPVRFDIPGDALASVKDEVTEYATNSVSWILEALGEPGNFWRGEYEVPVFRTDHSPAPTATPTMEQLPALLIDKLRGQAYSEKNADLIERPASSRIILRATGEGLEIAYPYRTAFLVATAWVVLTLPLYVAPLLVSRWWPQAEQFLSIEGALAAGLVFNALPAFLLLLYEPRRVVIGAREIVVTCGWALFGGTRRFDLADYDGVQADPQFFAVLRKNASFFKRRFFLATRLESHAESRWLASEVDTAVRKGQRARAIA